VSYECSQCGWAFARVQCPNYCATFLTDEYSGLFHQFRKMLRGFLDVLISVEDRVISSVNLEQLIRTTLGGQTLSIHTHNVERPMLSATNFAIKYIKRLSGS
jgi:hypothetical protein